MSDKILITGGAGFIGRRVVARFLEAESRIISLGLPSDQRPTEWPKTVDMIACNILDPIALRDAVRGCNTIIHLAGPVGLAGDYDGQWAAFVDGTRNICMTAEAGASVVVVSSIAVYGSYIQDRVCDEQTGFGPFCGAYGRAKQGQEDIARQIAKERGLDLTIIRPANVYGLGGGGAWGDRLLDSIAKTGGALIGEADTNNAGLLHVDNLADALFLCARLAKASGKIYNVCDGEDVSWARFMTDMAQLVGKPSPPHYPLKDILALIDANEDPARMIPPSDPNLPFMEGVNLVGFDNRISSQAIRSDIKWSPKIRYEAEMERWNKLHGND
ncbi:MAG: NAD(P)-dependent oxidoreductase [Pseudomonadota bacterium]